MKTNIVVILISVSTFVLSCFSLWKVTYKESGAETAEALECNQDLLTNGYAVYENWALSVVDYGLWQRRYASGLTEDEYYASLKDKYAEDDDYVPKVKCIAEEVKMCMNILKYQKN